MDEEIIDDPGGLEDWERELEEEEERRREREKDLEEKPRNDFAKEKETEAGRCPHCFMWDKDIEYLHQVAAFLGMQQNHLI